MTVQSQNGQAKPAHPLADRMARRRKKRQSTTVLCYGKDGVGKTSFAKDAPNPFFLCAEDSDLPEHVKSVTPVSWSDALEIVHTMRTNPMDVRTFVVDTVDWLEPKAIRHICERDDGRYKGKLMLAGGRPFLEGYGFNKGSDVLLEEWRVMLSALEALREEHDINIVLLGHAGTHRLKNAAGDDYDEVGPKVDKKTAGLLCEWPKAVLYAEFEKTIIERADESKPHSKAKVVTDGTRVCWTQNRGAHRAKNRCGMPEAVPFSWAEFARYALADTDDLMRQVEAKLKILDDPDTAARARERIAQERGEAGILLRSLERLDELIKAKPSVTAKIVSANSKENG